MGLLQWSSQKIGFVSLLEKHVKEIVNKQNIHKFHCIINQDARWVMSAVFGDVMKVVVKAVSFILSRVLNHLQFQDLLAGINSQYNDLLYFCEVLSRGKMSERISDLREEITTFLEE